MFVLDFFDFSIAHPALLLVIEGENFSSTNTSCDSRCLAAGCNHSAWFMHGVRRLDCPHACDWLMLLANNA